eukprot:595162-Rhodomonas_salina.1
MGSSCTDNLLPVEVYWQAITSKLHGLLSNATMEPTGTKAANGWWAALDPRGAGQHGGAHSNRPQNGTPSPPPHPCLVGAFARYTV